MARDSGYSIKRLFWGCLARAPTFQIQPKQCAHLMVDGTYFSNGLCLVLYYDSDSRYTQRYRFSHKEDYREMREDLENLCRMKAGVESITCDGHRSLLRAVRRVYPGAIL